MQSRTCPACGRAVPARAMRCEHCGVRLQPTGQRLPVKPSLSSPPAGPVNPAHAFARAPTRPPSGAAARQRPAPLPQPDNPARPAAPRKRSVHLILLLAALVGIVIGGTIGFVVFARKGGPTRANSGPTGDIVGTVSFTASGGLAGKFTISLPENAIPASSIQRGASVNVLQIVLNNATMDFGLTLSPYPGPGSYMLSAFQTNPAPDSFNGTVRISDKENSWSLQQPAQCTVSVASETPLNQQAQGRPLHEVKGGFSCPKLVSSGKAAPIKVTQGQFDVYVEMFGS